MTQPDAREGQAGLPGVSERSIVPPKPGNAGGGKGPQFKVNVEAAESRAIGVSLIPSLTDNSISKDKFRHYARVE